VNIRFQHITRKIEAALDQFFIAFVDAVFMLDADHIIIAHGGERSKDPGPIDIAETRQTRNLPAHALRKHTVVVETLVVNVQILGMEVEDFIREFADHALVVDHLQDEMGRVKVQSKFQTPLRLEIRAADFIVAVTTNSESLVRHSRMHLAGIQANSDWTPDKNIRG